MSSRSLTIFLVRLKVFHWNNYTVSLSNRLRNRIIISLIRRNRATYCPIWEITGIKTLVAKLEHFGDVIIQLFPTSGST